MANQPPAGPLPGPSGSENESVHDRIRAFATRLPSRAGSAGQYQRRIDVLPPPIPHPPGAPTGPVEAAVPVYTGLDADVIAHAHRAAGEYQRKLKRFAIAKRAASKGG